MHHQEFGQPRGAAPSVLLSAGLGGLGGFWRPQLAALGERHHVITYDHRGTGANSETLPAGYTIAMMAADVARVMDAAGVERCHFMGHALGGLVGLELALSAPGRLASLMLVNAWDRMSAPTRRCFEARRTLLEQAGPAAYVRAQAIFLYPAAWLARHAAAVAQEEEHALAHFQGPPTLLARIAAIEAFDVHGRLGALTTPTLAVASRDDVLVPYTCSEELAAAIPGCQLVVLPGGGHSCCVTGPEAFNAAVLGFLDGLLPGAGSK